jgi:ATP-binding protein involved in chromosome partitioning
MKIEKQQIKDALSEVKLPESYKSICGSEIVKNIQIFGTEIVLDLEISNPTLQYKKRIEADCLKTIHDKVYKKAVVKVNFSLIQEDQSNVIKGKEIPGVKNIIAISSGKGGVGKSTITANLAVALSDFGYKVGVVDADIYGPSMHIMFGLEGAVPEAIEVKGESKIKPLENYGVKLLSIGFFAQSQQAVVWRGPMASKALNQLLWDANWGELDYLLIDLPPGTGDIHLSLVQSIPVTGAVVVSTPQAIALADAKKGVNMFQLENINVPVLGIVENMAYFTPEELPNNKYYIFGKEGSKALAHQMNIDLLGEIPLVQSVREASDIGRPAVLQGSTEVAIALSNLAKKVIKKIEKRNLELERTKVVEISNTTGCSIK